MKKLLATLLVAMMIMSCMSVVSFANEVTGYMAEDVLGSEFFAMEDGYYIGEAIYVYNDFVNQVKGWTAGSKVPQRNAYANGGTDPLYTMAHQLNTVGSTTTAPISAIDVKSNTYVPVCIYVENAAVASGYLKYDKALLAPVYGKGGLYLQNFTEKDGAAYFNAMTGSDGDITGCICVVYFEVIATEETVGDANGELVTEITYYPGSEGKVEDTTYVKGTFTNDCTSVKLCGLAKGGSTEPTITDITSDEVAAITPVVAGTYAAADMLESINAFTTNAADLTVNDLADEFDAENMSYIPVFATIPTENKNAPTAYGIIIEGEGVDKLTIPVTNAVDGKFGVMLYGFTGHLDKYTKVSVYVTVGTETYTSAVGNL